MKNPEYSELTYYNRSFSTIYRTCTVYTDTKIANNTNINQIMISFTDHYNAISIDRLPSKTKTGKESWYFNDSLACKTDFSSATKNLLPLPKTPKNKYSSTSDWWKFHHSRKYQNFQTKRKTKKHLQKKKKFKI